MGKINRYICVITALLISHYCAPAVFAADDDAEESLRNNIDGRVRYSPRRAVKNSSGKIGILESEAEYSHEFKVFGKLPVELSIGSQYIDIDSDVKDVRLPSFLTGVKTGVEATFPFFKVENTYIRAGVSPSFYSDGWDFDGSSFRMPSRVFLIYRPNPKLIFIGGVALFELTESEVLPILGVIYKPTDKLTFNLTPDDPNISYALTDKVSLFAEADISLDEFAIGGANTEDVYLRYDEWHAGGGVRFKPNKNFEFSVSAGGIFGRSLEYSDDRSKASIKDGFYTELKASAAF